MKWSSCDSNKAKQTMMESLTETELEKKKKKKCWNISNDYDFFNSNANYYSSNPNKRVAVLLAMGQQQWKERQTTVASDLNWNISTDFQEAAFILLDCNKLMKIVIVFVIVVISDAFNSIKL